MQYVKRCRKQFRRDLPIFVNPDEQPIAPTQHRIIRNVRDELPASMRGRVRRGLTFPNPPDIAGLYFAHRTVRTPQLEKLLEGKVKRSPIPPTGLDPQPIVPWHRTVRTPQLEKRLEGTVHRRVYPPPGPPLTIFGRRYGFRRYVRSPHVRPDVREGRLVRSWFFASGLNAPAIPDSPPLRPGETDSFALRADATADSAALRASESATVALRPGG